MRILTIAVYATKYGIGIELYLSSWGLPWLSLKPVNVVDVREGGHD